MAIFPGAKLRLIPKWNQLRMVNYRRMNLHVAVWERDSLYGLFSASGANACSHFYVAFDGGIEQYIDTKYRSAADLGGSDSTISVETAGGMSNVNGEEWTPAQVVSLIKLWTWARDTHGIPNKLATGTDTIADSTGLSWHRLGIDGNFSNRQGIARLSRNGSGIKYSGVYGKECPGDAKILQIPGIFDAANGKGLVPVADKINEGKLTMSEYNELTEKIDRLASSFDKALTELARAVNSVDYRVKAIQTSTGGRHIDYTTSSGQETRLTPSGAHEVELILLKEAAEALEAIQARLNESAPKE